MTKRFVTRGELLDRWRGIEEQEENDVSVSDPSKRRIIRELKEQWFSDAFNVLICLPKENHIWCGSGDIMGPLLETFYNYCKEDCHDSPLKILWKRISEEMQQCTQCILHHHQAQELYHVEYDSETVGPLLDVLRCLDEERVTQHLKEINARIAQGSYDPVHENAEVVSVMFEVLMFPTLLDDQSLVTEFQIFIESIDDEHELALAGHQQYLGVYALLFSKSRRVRAIGHRLAACMGKLRRAADLEPLQPLLKKCVGILSTDALPLSSGTSRPRVQLGRISVWIGIKALLGFLEPPAFEEGILERYPSILSIVLDHISDDSVEFSYAVICLKLLFEMLGCKLWLNSTFSPSVMRNTLLGQCFHTRNEKSHKEIFDIFQPFLQSLEALQDGEHEKQRRHFLYFLLHQVTVSSNFSVLMRKKACQIAILIIHRGYKMNPPCPPFECTHTWGPALVSALKDYSLDCSFRRPAFELIQTILVSDAAALVSSLLNNRTPLSVNGSMLIELDDEEDDDRLPLYLDVEEKDSSCWGDFIAQSKTISRETSGWMCIPMLWIDVLVEIDPTVLPVSFSKAVFWARSRFTIVEPENSAEMEVPVRDWLLSCATELSASLGWKVPTGSDDGGEGKVSKNSIEVSTMLLPLIRTFKRLTAHFVVQLEQGELCKQWAWEPRMGESLVLWLLDSNDKVRQVSRCILEQVSNTRGLGSGLRFLCSGASCLSAVLMGLRHAFNLVQLDSVLLNFQTLHNFFFVLCKLLKEGLSSTPAVSKSSSDDSNTSRISCQGGFLRQPVFESPAADIIYSASTVDIESWQRFSCLASEFAWPSVRKCLAEGKAFIDYKISQMTCVRLLEVLPVVFEKLHPSVNKFPRNSRMLVENVYDFKWLHDLMDWGNSSLEVIVRYWKQAVIALLDLFKESCSHNSVMIIRALENLIASESIIMDDLVIQVSRLSLSLSNEAYFHGGKANLKPKAVTLEGLSLERNNFTSDAQPYFSKDVDVRTVNSSAVNDKRDGQNVVVLSDDESEKQTPPREVIPSQTGSNKWISQKTTVASGPESEVSGGDISEKKSLHTDPPKMSLQAFPERDASDRPSLSSLKENADISSGQIPPSSLRKSKGVDSKKEKRSLKCDSSNSFPSQFGGDLNRSSDGTSKSRNMGQTTGVVVSETNDTIVKEIAHNTNTEGDPWELALQSARSHDLNVTKPSKCVPKRQVIHLNLPNNRSGYLHRLETGKKRFRPPRLDDWYRAILDVNFFVTVGLASVSDDEKQTARKLKEVPVCFQSAEEYLDIFRPLVLEEFKAQLRSSFLETSSMEEMCFGCLSVLSVERVDDFHIVRFVHDGDDGGASRSFSENDLVLLTRQPLQTSSHDVHLVGKVDRRERDNKRRSSVLIIRFYLQNGSSRLNRARSLLHERSKWHASRIMSITPQLREFQALSLLEDIPILATILQPIDDSKFYDESRDVNLSKLPQPLLKMLKSSFNDSQLRAISVAIGYFESNRSFGLSLIQGPPGTGKTRTIVAIVSALLASPLQVTHNTKKSLNDSMKPSSTSSTNSRPKISQSVAIARAWQDAAFARQLNEDSVERSARGRVLICAQSNAAVDELVARISSEGLYGNDGKMYKPYLVRVGNAKTVHPNSLPFFIDTLVDQRLVEERMNRSDARNDLCEDTSIRLRSTLEKLVDRIRLYEAKRANLRDASSDSRSSLEGNAPKGDERKEMSDAEIEAKLKKLYEQKKSVYKELAITQAREKKAYEEIKALKHKFRRSILKEAEIVVTTLSGCGGDLYGVCSESISSYKFGNPSETTLFDAVVIDEAAQALEPATLIPLQLLKSYGTRCIMVGDPKQLPATVLSNLASKFLFECSMFERLQRAGHPVIMLTEQYRMHPEICRFPSKHFYDSKLLNGDGLASKSVPFHETLGLGPYVFFDVSNGQELRGKNSGALSLYNECEADAAVEVLRYFKKRYPSEFVGRKIGIITPYKCQLSLLRSRFSSVFGSPVTADMEFNTVDGFQGREVDILVLSTVRAADQSSLAPGIDSSSIGFVADVRRMNVALTRAKLSLWILGNARTLQTNHNWAALVEDARERNLVISAKMPYDSMFKVAFQNLPGSQNLVHRSKSFKHGEKVRSARQSAEQVEGTAKESYERKCTGLLNKKRTAADELHFSGTKGVVRSDKKRAVHEHTSGVEVIPSSVVADRESKTSSAVKSAITRLDLLESENKGKGQNKRNFILGDTHNKIKEINENVRSNTDQSVKGTRSSDSVSKSQVLRGPKKSYKGDISERNMDVSTSSSEVRIQEVDAISESRATKQVDRPKDLIAKRKQQREAVESLLSSSLISSKKPEPSLKSVPIKRPLSPATIATGSKPPKPRKGEPKDQIHPHSRK